MAHALADDFFVGFDVSDRDKPFLLDVLAAPGTPVEESQAIYDICLFSGFEDWHLMLQRAVSIKENSPPPASDLDARDVLAYIPRVTKATLADEKLRKGWAATDQSIKNLAALHRVHRLGLTAPPRGAVVQHGEERIVKREGVTKREREDDADEAEPKRVKRQKTAPKAASHYFAQQENDEPAPQQPDSPATSNVQLGASAIIRNGIITPRKTPRKSNENEAAKDGPSDPQRASLDARIAGLLNGGNDDIADATLANPSLGPISVPDDLVRPIVPPGFDPSEIGAIAGPSLKRKGAITSPFFTPAPVKSPVEQSPKKRNGGLVSTIPFPPLTAPRFGLIQEEFAHDPFWLMVVVTFLVKTAGTLAIPTFYKVKELYPKPAQLADPDPATTTNIMEMIHHLGLSVVRTASIQRYARLWLEKPPTAGVLYRVKKYDKRVVQSSRISQELDEGADADQDAADDAWEMGHFTQGKYALDSWRIFCRDELLGRAQDWNGKGAAPNFQPEWMRVRPDDKELRACLRWMWMREGWEWDPVTGEKTVLREEMQRAVNERRVEYDEVGGLRILDEPRPDSA